MKSTVTKIEATIPFRPNMQVYEPRNKLRVAAYARVSTEKEPQEESYENQIEHFTKVIQNNPDWHFAGMYADEGLSGTQAKKRPNFMRMIEDCEKGLIDQVIVKSISRWSRNTLDSLTYARRLKELGIPIIFEQDNVDSMSPKCEFTLTVLSSIAQQESLNISMNTRAGIRYRFDEGIGRLNTSIFLGLEKGEGPGKYVINPAQAIVARRIFREFLEGYSPAMIADHLTVENVPTPGGGEHW